MVNEPDQIILSTASDPEICIGQSVSLQVTATGGSNYYNYLWSSGNTGNSINVSPFTTTSYSVTVTDQNGCTSAPGLITVNVLDSLKLTVSPSVYICAGDTVTLHATASGGNGNYSFNWSPGNFHQGSYLVSPQETTNYTVVVNDGCGTPVVTSTVNVQVTPLPVPDFTADVTEGCAPLCVYFTDKSTFTGTNATYTWTTDNISVTSHSNVFHLCYDYPGNYDVGLTVTDAAGCSGKITKPGYIKVSPVPVADFYTNPSYETMNPEIIFINNSQGATLYHWNFGDGYEETNTYPNTHHIYADTGKFCIELTAINNYGCFDKSEECIKILAALQVYIPNAFTPDGHNNIFNFKGMGIDPDGFVLNIFNRWGELVYNTYDPERGWNGRKIDGTKAPTDVYVYKFIMKDLMGKSNEFTGYVTVLY